jgi:uncharacterized protein
MSHSVHGLASTHNQASFTTVGNAMLILKPTDPLAVQVKEAITNGDVPTLRRLLQENSGLATTYIGTAREQRSLLHILADSPGHRPNARGTLDALKSAGADVNAPFIGQHTEQPLHWAASNDDVDLVDALLDAGADINAPGAVIGGGSPLADARAFLQLRAAQRLVERGALVTLPDAATLGHLQRVQELLDGSDPPVDQEDLDLAVWHACHGGQLAVVKYLHSRGARLDVKAPWDDSTPLDAAKESKMGSPELVSWLQAPEVEA